MLLCSCLWASYLARRTQEDGECELHPEGDEESDMPEDLLYATGGSMGLLRIVKSTLHGIYVNFRVAAVYTAPLRQRLYPHCLQKLE